MAFRPTSVASLGLLVALLLAGCAKDPAPLAAAPVADGDGAAISGEVFDAENLPVANATVSLADAKTFSAVRNATTDASGRFDLGKVVAGSWVLVVSASGFEVLTKNLTVVAGEDQHPKVVLSPLPVAEPYYETVPRTLHIQYGVAWSVGGDFNRGCLVESVTCQALVEQNTLESFWTNDDNYDPTRGAPHLATVYFEETWQANSPVCAKAIAIDMYTPDAASINEPRKENPHYWTNSPHDAWQMTSPIVMVIPRVQDGNPDAIDDPGRIEKNGNSRLWVRGEWTVRNFPPGTGLTNQPIDINCFTDQSLDLYFTAFYFDPAPTGFTARPA